MVENCVDCGNSICDDIANQSRKKYGKPICTACQKKQTEQKRIESNQENRKDPVIAFQDLLSKAHKEGLVEINTEELPKEKITLHREKKTTTGIITESIETEMYKFKATAVFVKEGKKKTFMAHGDAHIGNSKEHMIPHIYRFAESRALSRALRFALGEGVAAEELDDLPDRSKPEITETVVKG